MTTCQEEGRESEEWKEPCFRYKVVTPEPGSEVLQAWGGRPTTYLLAEQVSVAHSMSPALLLMMPLGKMHHE